jgi:hypothetical protein
MRIVYATATTTVSAPGGLPVQVTWGSHWPASDPVVKAHPELFTDDPTPGLRVSAPLEGGTAAATEAPVEQATRAPGERRPTRRA